MAGRNRQLKAASGRPGAWVSKSPAKSQAAWKQDTLEGLEKGSRVWYKAGANSWVLGTLQKAPQPGQQGGQWTVALDSEAGEGTGQVRVALFCCFGSPVHAVHRILVSPGACITRRLKKQ